MLSRISETFGLRDALDDRNRVGPDLFEHPGVTRPEILSVEICLIYWAPATNGLKATRATATAAFMGAPVLPILCAPADWGNIRKIHRHITFFNSHVARST